MAIEFQLQYNQSMAKKSPPAKPEPKSKNNRPVIVADGVISFNHPTPKATNTLENQNPPKIVELKEFEDSLRGPDGKIAPRIIKQEMAPLHVKRQEIAHIFYDAKLEDREQIRKDAKEMEWDLYSKVTSRFDTTREVKLDHNITAMGILGLLTGDGDE